MNALIHKSTDNFLFYNNRIVFSKKGLEPTNKLLVRERKQINTLSSKIAKCFVAIGDFYLTPVRYFYNGNKVTIGEVGLDDKTRPNIKLVTDTVKHQKEYTSSKADKTTPRKNFIRTAFSILLFIPGLILGSLFKKIGYYSEAVKVRHNLAVEHFTPEKKQIGDTDDRKKTEKIAKILGMMNKDDLLNRPLAHLVIYAEKGTTLAINPELFLKLNPPPQKVVIDGAKIESALSSELAKDPRWIRDKGLINPTNSVKDALNEKLPEGRRKFYVVA